MANSHPQKEYFRKLIEAEMSKPNPDPEKLRQLRKEEEAHNHPNRYDEEHH